MKFIVDVHVASNPKSTDYPGYLFADVLSGKITLVMGGKKYKDELVGHHSLLSLLNEFSDSGRIMKVSDSEVASAKRKMEALVNGKFSKCPPECDDFHIFALAQVGKCEHVLSKDDRIAKCRRKIRPKIGHSNCPNLKVIFGEAAYKKLRK